MKSGDKLIVMKKDGFSYVEGDRWRRDRLVVNGQKPAPCPGNDDWSMIKGDIVSIDYIIPASREHTGFRIKPELALLVHGVESELPVGSFELIDEEWSGEHAELYEAAYRDVPPVQEPVKFDVIDYDCEPVAMPSYVEVDFPANLRFHRAVQHKYPCRIAMPSVFHLVADAVVAETQKHKGLYRLHDCRNIEILGVDAVIATKPHDVRRDTSWGRRPKWKTVTVTETTKRVLGIVGSYRDKSGYEQITGLDAPNYAELDAKLTAYIGSFVERIDPRRWKVCPHCDGEGLVQVEA